MSMKRTILIKEVKYSNQAKTLLGMMKIAQVVTKKMVTVHMVNDSATSMLVHKMKNDDYSSAARHPLSVAGICTLTRDSLREVSTCPELYEDIEESGFRGNNGGPACARVNCRP